MQENFITEEMGYQEENLRREIEFEKYVNGRIVEINTGEVLIDKSSSGKIHHWEDKKAANLQMVELYRMAMKIDENLMTTGRLFQMEQCGDYLVFGSDESGKRKLVDANFCRVRHCPLCNWRRSLKMFAQVSEITEVIMQEKSVRFIFLTLTVRNPTGEQLSSTLDNMNMGFKYLTQKSIKFAPTQKLKENLLGYLKATEVTYNSKDNTYHLHFHILLEVRPSYFGKNYIRQAEFSYMWKQAMKLDYDPIVDVRVVKNATAHTVAEVAKYPTKSADLLTLKDKERAAQALITLHKALHNRRLITFGGDFKVVKARLKLDDVETGSLIHIETEQEQQLNAIAYTMFKYNAKFGCYIC